MIKATIDTTLDSFWESLPPVWQQIREQIRLQSETHDLTVEQFQLLRHIRRGCATVSELVEARGISRPGVSQAVDGLVRKGLIARRDLPDDRRFVQVQLTPTGTALVDMIFDAVCVWMRQRLAGFSCEELQTMGSGMQLLRQAFIPGTAEAASPVSARVHLL